MTTAVDGLNADKSIRQDIFFKPETSTPEKNFRFRNSYRERVGVKQLHWGIYNDDKSYEKIVNGVPTKDSEHVIDCIKGQNLGGVGHYLNEIKEDKYASKQRYLAN